MNHSFRRKRSVNSDRLGHPSAYQPNALPIGPTLRQHADDTVTTLPQTQWWYSQLQDKGGRHMDTVIVPTASRRRWRTETVILPTASKRRWRTETVIIPTASKAADRDGDCTHSLNLKAADIDGDCTHSLKTKAADTDGGCPHSLKGGGQRR